MWKAENDDNIVINEVIDQLEPVQCAWKWMPVISLENYLGTDIVNGSLCWIVHVVLKDNCQIPAAVLVVAAKTKEEAMEKVGEQDIQALLAQQLIVPLVPVKRQGRKAIPFAPVWCMTVHKVQGATLEHAVLNIVDHISAPVLYTAITRVRTLDNLWFLQKMSPSLFLTMSFSPHVNQEMKRLRILEDETKSYLLQQMTNWSKFVPRMIEVEWLKDTEESRYDEEDIKKTIFGASVLFESSKIVCIPVKYMNLIGDVTAENWIQAATMICCPAILQLQVKQQQIAVEYPNIDGNWSVDQANQIRRIFLILKDAETSTGSLFDIKWTSMKKREQENEWKKLFTGSKNTCMKVLKQVLKEDKKRKIN